MLDVCQSNGFDVEGACGGECCCSTCHLYVQKELYDKLPKPDDDELDMLDLAIEVKETSRLGCQIHVAPEFAGMKFFLPKAVVNNLDESRDKK